MLSINRKSKRATAGVLDELLMFSLSSPQVPYSISVEHACDSSRQLFTRHKEHKNQKQHNKLISGYMRTLHFLIFDYICFFFCFILFFAVFQFVYQKCVHSCCSFYLWFSIFHYSVQKTCEMYKIYLD